MSEAGSRPAGTFSSPGTRPRALAVGEEGEGAGTWTIPFQVFSQLHHRILFLTPATPRRRWCAHGLAHCRRERCRWLFSPQWCGEDGGIAGLP